MRLAAYISTYDRPVHLADTLRRIMRQTTPPEEILVVDNGNHPDTRAIVELVAGVRGVYHSMGFNAGPAGAGAYALETLVHAGYDWMYCGDDDDPPLTDDTFARLMRLTDDLPEPAGAVGVIGSRWDWKWGVRERVRDLPETGVYPVDVIGGGRQFIVSRQAVQSAGLPDARLFFGQEDFEYCLRIRKHGFSMAVDADLFRLYGAMIHQRRTRVWRRGALRPPDEIWRQYYNTRNYIFFMRNGFDSHRLAALEAIKSVGRVLLSFKAGYRYARAFGVLQLRGVVDGYLGRLGMTVSPTRKSRHAAPLVPSSLASGGSGGALVHHREPAPPPR